MTGARRVILAISIGSFAACQANDDAFYDVVMDCTAGGAKDQCGTTRSGQPMTCYPGSQLGGGRDFCTETCDADGGAAEPGFVCLASGARLRFCTPDPPDGGTNGCPGNLNCFRTDLAFNEGVCLWMDVCTTDVQCATPTRPKCTATIIHDLLPLITTDNLYCTKASCASSGSACPDNEVCSASFYALPTGADICVPQCVMDADCPPDFACAFNPSAAGAPYICLPGVPGERCNHDEDCLLGSCLPTGAGFRECIFLPCTQDSDCAAFDAEQTFVCANDQCVGLTPYHGTGCLTDGDCPSKQSCFFYSPYLADETKGECRLACDADLTCPARAGVPEVCLDHGAGGCYPGDFGLPCTDTSQCLSFFQCLPVSPDPRTIIDSPSICTTTCATDDDCRSIPAVRTGGFCEAGVCRLGGHAGVTCDRDAECLSGHCLTGLCSS
jgi:hypothetical protein